MRHLRFSLFSGVLLLSLTGLLVGCGVGAPALPGDVPSDPINGIVYGGQNPIVGASIYVVYYGYSGYGSGTLATPTPVTTASDGSFNFPSGYYTCSPSTAQIYLLSVGGNTGSGANANAVLAAPIGTCGNVSRVRVVMNEVSTISVAYALSHFFPTTLGGAATGDLFGGPAASSSSATYYPDSNGIGLGNSHTAALIDIQGNGYSTPSSGIMTTESSKVITLANVIGACVNSGGGVAGDGSNCGKLFTDTTTPGGQVPTDTLQAAVQMAIYPTQNVSALYTLGSSRNVAFSGGLSSTPSDLSLAVSYTSSTLGLGVDTGTLSTIDIDSNGRIWFPSTASGYTGVAYFDPTQSAFFGPYNGPGLVHPGQVAIDKTGLVWVTDTQGSVLGNFTAGGPASYGAKSLTNSKSFSVTIGSDNSVMAGVEVSTTFDIARVNPSTGVYATAFATTPAAYNPFSLAANNSTGFGLEVTTLAGSPNADYIYEGTSTATTFTRGTRKLDLGGQAAWNGSNFIYTYANGGVSGNSADGICVAATCYSFTGTAVTSDLPQGLAVDGKQTLWFADRGNATVQYAAISSGSYINSSSQVATVDLTHNSSNGGTLTNPEAIAVDNEGNLWVANAGCFTTSCTPGSFVLTEIIGTAAPTITPVSAQVTSGSNLAGTEPTY